MENKIDLSRYCLGVEKNRPGHFPLQETMEALVGTQQGDTLVVHFLDYKITLKCIKLENFVLGGTND